jgi:hypothetical protein
VQTFQTLGLIFNHLRTSTPRIREVGLTERAGAVGIGDVLKKPLQSRDIAVSLAHVLASRG